MSKVIHTGLYSEIAKEVISAVLGQLSDGWGENNPANDKWWKFARTETDVTGEVIISIDDRDGDYGYHHKFTPNGFYAMPAGEIKEKFAKWIKKTMKMELDDNGITNGWKRGNVDFLTTYLNYHCDISVAQVYYIYEHLLGRDCSPKKYAGNIIMSVCGNKKNDDEIAIEKNKRAIEAEKIEKCYLERNKIDEWEKTEIAKLKEMIDQIVVQAAEKRAQVWTKLNN